MGKKYRSPDDPKHPERITVSAEELESLRSRIDARQLSEDDYRLLGSILGTIAFLRAVLEKKTIAVKRLLSMIFGSRTEGTRAVKTKLGSPGERRQDGGSEKESERSLSAQKSEKKPGHGRRGAAEFPAAERVEVRHDTLSSGSPCPQCPKGKLFDTQRPALLVQFTGNPPVSATVWECQSLRCSSCGASFTAEAPPEVRERKYAASATSTVAVLKYGHGIPFYRLAQLQKILGVPLPASTQWQLIEEQAKRIRPVYQELFTRAAQGELLHNDDTSMKILSRLAGRNGSPEGSLDSPEAERSGLFTSGIISVAGERKIALFFTGTRHAGENLARVLAEREAGRAPPIQMCDALSRNLPGKFKVILCNCLAHGRRRFVELAEAFPEECLFVLESLATVYRHDEEAKKAAMSGEERLRYHQAKSRPVMDKLESWFHEQIDEKKVEPNSTLGQAIRYFLNHWQPLTRFLHVRGAPLDNNIVERALKRVVLHRKNALFYKTDSGARVGDLYMSLIYTCLLCDENPVEYLSELDRHSSEIRAAPQDWLPWNFRERL